MALNQAGSEKEYSTMSNILATGGFPANYPYAQSSPQPAAILRPLQQPVYDTELIITNTTEIIFFQRQIGQPFANANAVNSATTKTVNDTSLYQPGSLPNPIEMSVFGFLFEVQAGCLFADFNQVYSTGLFTYTYTGNRVYLQVPINRIPQGVSPEGFASYTGNAATTGTNTTGQVHNGVGHVSNLYKFTIGRAALRIRPTESFQARLNYVSGTSVNCGTISGLANGNNGTGSLRLRTYIMGLTWTAL
jgi:hypothetical protein